MKELVFTAENKELYELIYDGALASPRGLDKAETRVAAKIMDKLESIGVLTNRGGKPAYTLNLEDGQGIKLSLEDTEFVLLKSQLEDIRWTTQAARRAARMHDWLDELDKLKA